MKKPVALIILDGWGNNTNLKGNAVEAANTPIFDNLMAKWPHTLVSASGMDVGLPRGQMGNSEVGHLNIGAGRVVYQELTRITKSIEDGDFFTNPVILDAVRAAKQNGKKLHVMGLLSDGGVHSHIDHVKALVDLAKKEELEQIYVHAFLDGRDTPPQSAIDYMKDLEAYMTKVGMGKTASVSGRYYSMDRDKRWERVEVSYNMLVYGKGVEAASSIECIENSYKNDINDEFVLPTVIVENGKPVATIAEGDSVIFFNFRPDRAREITRALVDPEFKGFECTRIPLHYVCLTQYDITMPNVQVAYAPTGISNTLGEYLAAQGKTQLRIAETEKYAHVTFFFNGGVEEANPGEERVLIPSPKVATYDLQPEMSANEVTDEVIRELSEDKFDFMVLNFANPDMVGHTGVFDAAVKAVETVDHCLGRVLEKIESLGGKAIITADHGNAEMMVDYETGQPMTAHTTNQVPCILIGHGENTKLREGGKLCDFAPTLLELLELPKPVEMDGISLIAKA